MPEPPRLPACSAPPIHSGVSKHAKLDIAPGAVAISDDELPALPDDLLANPRAGWLDIRRWFGEPSRDLEIEIGSGKGTFLVQQAALSPTTNYLGIEWSGEYFALAADRVRRHGLANVRLLCADAVSFLRWRVPDEIARVIHLYFSDPWPKKKHHKNRVVRDEFLREAWRVLRPADETHPPGELRIVTDHDEYWSWMQDHFARWTSPQAWSLLDGTRSMSEAKPPSDRAHGPFERVAFDRPDSAGEGEIVGTNFERKFRVEGRTFNACTLRKKDRDAQGS